MLRSYKLTISTLSALALAAGSAFTQTPQQIQQRQMAEERALQRDAEQREQQQHEAQLEQMRQIDRQQAEDARQRAEKARAEAIAAQEQLYQVQLAEQAKAQAQARASSQNQDPNLSGQPASGQTSQLQSGQPAQAAQPPPAGRWSYKNMSNLDKAGLAAMAVILAALAMAAGIIPSSRAPKWVGRFFIPPDRH